jgi:hypothetical protein
MAGAGKESGQRGFRRALRAVNTIHTAATNAIVTRIGIPLTPVISPITTDRPS